MSPTREELEKQLNSFDPTTRHSALEALFLLKMNGEIREAPPNKTFNLHCHTFFSYNGYGFSPTSLAWQGFLRGMYAMGIVDFDVLDAVEEFLNSCDCFPMRATCGIETRFFVPEFADKVINSPGEPGVAYHMGVGFTSKAIANHDLLDELRNTAQRRNRMMIEKVNAYLSPVCLEYAEDVVPFTPKGNVTERHICMAYDEKAKAHFKNRDALCAFWAEKLGMEAAKVEVILDDAPTLQWQIRAKTMKQGGVGYMQSEAGDFPDAKTVNAFTLSNNAIPCLAWLDGMSEGEKAMGELLELMMSQGVAAVNIIPDRNWNIKDPETKAKKVAAMDAFIALADGLDLPIIIGTEMNAYGQPFVDDFDAPEMKKHEAVFMRGTNILHAHTMLQRFAGRGYLSDWAAVHFPDTKTKNDFYAYVGGEVAQPTLAQREKLRNCERLEDILLCIGETASTTK